MINEDQLKNKLEVILTINDLHSRTEQILLLFEEFDLLVGEPEDGTPLFHEENDLPARSSIPSLKLLSPEIQGLWTQAIQGLEIVSCLPDDYVVGADDDYEDLPYLMHIFPTVKIIDQHALIEQFVKESDGRAVLLQRGTVAQKNSESCATFSYLQFKGEESVQVDVCIFYSVAAEFSVRVTSSKPFVFLQDQLAKEIKPGNYVLEDDFPDLPSTLVFVAQTVPCFLEE